MRLGIMTGNFCLVVIDGGHPALQWGDPSTVGLVEQQGMREAYNMVGGKSAMMTFEAMS